MFTFFTLLLVASLVHFGFRIYEYKKGKPASWMSEFLLEIFVALTIIELMIKYY